MRWIGIVVSCALLCACAGSSDKRPSDASEAGLQDAATTDASRADASTPDASTDAGTPPACEVVPPTVCPDPMPRYADVSPIFAARCVTCHNGTDGMWPLSSYQHVADWYGEIRAAMIACNMPPPESGLSMPLEERGKILDWIRCGFPR